MTPFFSPLASPRDATTHERPARLRRRAAEHRLALESQPRVAPRGSNPRGATLRRRGDER